MLEKVIEQAASPVIGLFWSVEHKGFNAVVQAVERVSRDFDDTLIFLGVVEDENPTPAGKYRMSTECPTVVVWRRGKLMEKLGVVAHGADSVLTEICERVNAAP
jgi:hypothetical protein